MLMVATDICSKFALVPASIQSLLLEYFTLTSPPWKASITSTWLQGNPVAKRKKRTSKKMVKVINSEGRGTEGMFHQAATLHEQGALDHAENLCQQILSDAPKHAWALNRKCSPIRARRSKFL